MSERSFFNIRYHFPGYTFLLFIVLFCIHQFIELSKQDNFGFFTIVFPFIYLLSGSPLGFLVSQVWYLYFDHWKKGYYWKKRCEKRAYIKYLYAIIEKSEILDDPMKAIIIIDYLYNKFVDDNSKSYVDRRWDLIHLMGSIRVSIILGILFGIYIDIKLMITMKYNYSNDFYIFYISFYVILLLLGLLIYKLIWHSMEKIEKEHDVMTTLIIRQIPIWKINRFMRSLENMYSREETEVKRG